MKTKKFTIAAGALALGLATMLTPGNAQGPMYDQVNVSLPYSVTIGERTLQPGDYWIRQLPSSGGASRVLLIYSNNGMKFETSAMTIPALDNRTPEDTKIVLHHFGPDYYFDKIWIQGKDYGYEFPLPDSVKARQRERMEPTSVAARYESVPDTTATAQTTTQSTTPAPAETTTTAQTTTPAPADTTPPATTQAQTTTADRTMPATAANWLSMLLGGGMLSGVGLALRRKR
jgi:hypothetical protein